MAANPILYVSLTSSNIDKKSWEGRGYFLYCNTHIHEQYLDKDTSSTVLSKAFLSECHIKQSISQTILRDS